MFITNNTPRALARDIREFFAFEDLTVSSKHLGLPLLCQKSKQLDFKDIQRRINGKITGWKAKLLSQVGRAMLIRSVASVIPMYGMSSILLPQQLCRSIDTQFRPFFWGFKDDQSHPLSLLSWREVCSPRLAGGLGIRLMAETNLALVSKLAWMVTTSSP